MDLYTPQTLLGEFTVDDPGSYARTLDARTYIDAVVNGLRVPRTDGESLRRAKHDDAITRALLRHLEGRRVVAIMGGHNLERASTDYWLVARVARTLTRKGYLMISGGGPGAMEATHLGARLANSPDDVLDRARNPLADASAMPDVAKLVDQYGTVNQDLMHKLHAWQVPAFEIVAETAADPSDSVAIPTWLYGFEPPTPFAMHLAKYFENSLREDGLLALARFGILYARGSAGTIQEIFQDAAQNYYATVDYFSPMVFLDVDAYWTKTHPVKPLLDSFIKEEDRHLISYVTDEDAAIQAIEGFEPPNPEVLERFSGIEWGLRPWG